MLEFSNLCAVKSIKGLNLVAKVIFQCNRFMHQHRTKINAMTVSDRLCFQRQSSQQLHIEFLAEFMQ